MDLDESYETKQDVKTCFKLHQNIIDSLNITNNPSSSMLIFWNKFQLFILNVINPNEIKYFVPEFHIKDVLFYNNYLICLDVCGNIHMTSLKFKNTTQTKFKISFQPKARNVLAISRHNENSVITFKYENDSYCVSIHKLNGDFQIETQATLHILDSTIPLTNSFIFCSQIISTKKHDYLLSGFNIKDTWKEIVFILVSFDKQTIWYSLISAGIAEDNMKLMKVYTCPSEICDIKIIESDTLNLIIGLAIGSVIKLPLDIKKPVIEHLNISLHKFNIINNCLYYTDGDFMWSCKELFSSFRSFTKLIVRNVNCFIQYENQLAITTFDNLIYLLPLHQENIYIQEENKDVYSPADKVLNNSDYLNNILEVLDKNKQIVQKLNEEKNYLLALALSNRPDIINNMIQNSVKLYYNYEDALKENSENIISDSLKKYFEKNIIILSIGFDCSNLNQFFCEMLSNLKHMRIHISFHTKEKTLKIHTIKMQKLLNLVNILVPLKADKISDKLSIKIKLISEIPTALDRRNKIWFILYNNCLVLRSEQFLKLEDNKSKIRYLKNSHENIEKLIYESACKLYGDLFKIKNNVYNEEPHTWNTYVKLAENFENILNSEEVFENLMNRKLAMHLLQQMRVENFIKCKGCITLHVNKVKVTVTAAREEFSEGLKLKISCTDVAIANNLRHFFSKEFSKLSLMKDSHEFICSDLYTTTENVKKTLQDIIRNGDQSNLLPKIEEFNKYVIGALTL